ncbi:hypothetical protein LZ30DRAFT_468380 [Colletotrichum cereale]|nr:hypothetical protein LZ30DRAFT_468380 [Colletotrichum cereale]
MPTPGLKGMPSLPSAPGKMGKDDAKRGRINQPGRSGALGDPVKGKTGARKFWTNACVTGLFLFNAVECAFPAFSCFVPIPQSLNWKVTKHMGRGGWLMWVLDDDVLASPARPPPPGQDCLR